MKEPLPLFHSWPLCDMAARVELAGLALLRPNGEAGSQSPPIPSLGFWSCDLADESLSWSRAVHDLFGLPVGEPVGRSLAVSLYAPASRAAMERLRAHAIRHRRGFTLDAQIFRLDGEPRWMRLSAAPVLHGRKVVRLTGTKRDVTAEYDGPEWRSV